MKTIYVRDFTKYPGARLRKLGPGSGEEFRDDFLIPQLDGKNIQINFDGTIGYGSSFLEEAFGGLIRKGIDKEIVLHLVDTAISDEDPLLKKELLIYVTEAIAVNKKGK
ncbi:hypothetical protein GCM10023211_21680 [Orbus sasakiae]|uniref:DUF4325 domain-containing protein n=1 Tax=Orbus sasakiae TaxID=1078475 RepID=A0ABP9NGB1_9GAMM